MERVKVASVHGRFQPFHNGHLGYVLQAFNRADFVWIGLTQIFRPVIDEKSAVNRDSIAANPLSFLDRRELVDAALTAAGIDRSRFRVTPFPIERPETLCEFIPADCVCFTTRVTEWNDEKVKRLQNHGFSTKILENLNIDNISVSSGTEIRQLIRSGNQQWKNFVPDIVAEMICEKFKDRF